MMDPWRPNLIICDVCKRLNNSKSGSIRMSFGQFTCHRKSLCNYLTVHGDQRLAGGLGRSQGYMFLLKAFLKVRILPCN